ncbi:MAG: glycosyl hydrolase family 65 protein [Candidatus Gastranaerophilales bacterium]|nr:glycosyl hydrolase family 65 protein [Candidatus Gastranaerophilales bacterium]
MKIKRKGVEFNPHLPQTWRKLRFHVKYKASTINLTIKQNSVKTTVLSGESVNIKIGKTKWKRIELNKPNFAKFENHEWEWS